MADWPPSKEPPRAPAPETGQKVGLVGTVRMAWYSGSGQSFTRPGRWWAHLELENGDLVSVPWEVCKLVLDPEDLA